MPSANSSLPYLAGLAILIAAVVLLLAATAVRAGAPPDGKSRVTLLDELGELEAAHRQRPAEADVAIDYARALYQSGEFAKALDVVLPLVEIANADREAVSLAARLAYLTGRYQLAAATYQRLIDDASAKSGAKLADQINLAMAYYQINEFDKTKKISFPAGVRLPNVEVVRAFDQAPYQLSWSNDEHVARVPFLVSDALPLVSIEFNGRPVTVIFDTGADLFILDPEIASDLGIKSVSTAVGTFGGGKQAKIGFAKIDSVRVGDLTFNQVPVMTLPTKRFSQAFADGKYTIGGFIGTAALRKCLGTIDYEHAQMILRERNQTGREQLQRDLGGQVLVEMPFALDSTHMMMARGSLNDRDGLTFFVDSGLASEAAFSAPRQTLEYAGIPLPQTRLREGPGGGGGSWAAGEFAIQRLALGGLAQSDLKGEYGSRTPSSYWEHGFIQDGLISHRFLRQYASWTIDFDRMRYVFAK